MRVAPQPVTAAAPIDQFGYFAAGIGQYRQSQMLVLQSDLPQSVVGQVLLATAHDYLPGV
jgi:hypothetical protein